MDGSAGLRTGIDNQSERGDMKSSIRAIALGLCATAIFLSAVGSASATEPSWHLGEAEIPAETTANVFRDVTIFEKEGSIAVGNSTTSGGGSLALIEVGGAGKWNRWPNSIKGLYEYPGGVLESVVCPSQNVCLAVGYYTPKPGTRRALTARMSPAFEWTLEKGPLVGTDEFTELNGISCPSTGGCQAVGRTKATSTSTSSKTLAMVGNGLGWEQLATPSPGAGENRLTDVSCLGLNLCMAVGQVGTSTLSESYNGTEWKQVGVSSLGSFEGVSCSASTACTAVGSASGKIIARRWNGTSWAFQTPVLPTGSSSSSGSDVTCLSATSCVAVGGYVNASGSFALAERWDGTTWSQDSTPTPGGSSARSFLGVACSTSVLCTAVGSATFSGVVKPLVEWYS